MFLKMVFGSPSAELLRMASLVAQWGRICLPMQETQAPSLGQEDSPGEGNGYPLQDSCLENPMDRGAYGLQSMGLQRVRHDGVTKTKLN